MNNFTVYKLNSLGETELSYQGDIIERGKNYVCVRASFTFSTRDLGYVVLKMGDIFTEWFYGDKWYNVFRVQDVDSGDVKGYYCNLTRPAVIGENDVKAEDLALDVFVRPDSSTLLRCCWMKRSTALCRLQTTNVHRYKPLLPKSND
jgi:uncharacterized protein